MTASERPAVPAQSADPAYDESPAIAHQSFHPFGLIALCGAHLIGVKAINPERTCDECARLLEHLFRGVPS